MPTLRERARSAYLRGELRGAAELLAEHCQASMLVGDWLDLGRLRQRLNDRLGARLAFERAFELDPASVPAARALARLLVELAEPEQAYRILSRLRLRLPSDPALAADLAVTADHSNRSAEALALYNLAIIAAPSDPGLRLNRAKLLSRSGRHTEALADHRVMTGLDPHNALAWHGQAEALRQMHEPAAAIAACEQALACQADYVPALVCKAVVLAMAGECASAQAVFDRAYRIDPGAVQRYAGNAAILPNAPDARAVYLLAAFDALKHAQWQDYPTLINNARQYFSDPILAPSDLSVAFPTMYLSLDQRASSAAHIAVARTFENLPPARHRARVQQRLRIGYIATSFCTHPAMILTAGLFAAHDRGRFSVHGYALNTDDGSPERRRAAAEFDSFTDLSALDDEQAAECIAADGVDLLIDLNGFGDEARPGVLARRPARLQLMYFYIHSVFAPWIDYRITDHRCEPREWGHPLREARAFMPSSFFPYGRSMQLAQTPGRAEFVLPADAFVMCAFTRIEKISPQCFALWMDIMRRLPHAVLWLLSASPRAEQALRVHAQAAGVDAGRIVFAARAAHADHLARHRAADIYLDTHPCNAHTTALDALHAGLPVLTLEGESWASRIGASFLATVKLSQLIATSPQDYCRLALRLGQDPAFLLDVTGKLRTVMAAGSPFAVQPAARRLEAAFTHIWTRYRAGLAPADFDVEEI